jgi:hypothetical protein
VIIKGGSRKNGRFFARHLTNAKDNERVRVVEFRGFANEDVKSAFQSMETVARGTRCQNYFYHADLNPREGERLTDAQWESAVDTLERHLGLQGQPRFVVEHEKEGRIHRHVVWQRVDVDTMRARPDSLTYQKHEAAAREIECDCRLEPVPSVLVKGREGPRPARRARDFEGFRGSKTGLSPEEVRSQVTRLWRGSDTGSAFHAALQAKGYILCRGDRRDFCIIDPAGDDHSLARRITGVKAAEVRERMKDVDRDALPSVEEGRELAHAWGDSDAARAVRLKELDDKLKEVKSEAKQAELSAWWRDQKYFLERMGREGFEYQPSWSMLEKAAQQYGVSVKQVARAAQDAYWQAFIGGAPHTEADKLHALMWAEDRDREDGQGWDR